MSGIPTDFENPWIEETTQSATLISDVKPSQKSSLPLRAPSTRKPTETVRLSAKKLSHIGIPASKLVFGVCLINFHHLRGPEVEYSFPVTVAADAAQKWPYLPFQALPDGSHAFEETFSYFTLEYFDPELDKQTTLFAISCARQIKSDELLQKDDDVTRSSVQKSIVVILRQPIFGQIKEKLSIVTKAFFDQRNFNDKTIIDALYHSLRSIYNDSSTFVDESDFYLGLSPREILNELKKDVLVILKAMLLEKKIAFYSSNPTKLCLTEFTFISLIPNLINNLRDCSSPTLDSYSESLVTTTSFKTSDRNSVLNFAGLPLQIFGKGGIFSPYSPLQQFEDLKKTRYYVIGTSNALLLNNKDKLADLLVNLETNTIEIINPDLTHALQLSSADKKWMLQLLSCSPVSPTESYSGFIGSDDYIRWQFEDYFTGLLATVKYDIFLNRDTSSQDTRDYDGNQLKNFNTHFINLWKQTNNYKLFVSRTDDHIFDVFEPKHVYVDESKSLSEKFQRFKLDNSKKLEEYKKNILGKESLKNKSDSTTTHNSDASPDSGESHKKPHSANKIWNWYNKIKDKDHE